VVSSQALSCRGIVRSYVEGLVEPIANELLDAIGMQRGRRDSAFSRPFPFRVITRLFGIPVTDEPKLLSWALKLIDYPWDPDGAVRARHDFAGYLKPFLDERRVNPGDDLLSKLAIAEFEGHRLSDEEIYSFARMIYPAGSDTAYKNGGSLLYAILRDPALHAKARAGDAERQAIAQEGLRWEPPVANLPRICSADVTLGGVEIRKGQWTLFGISAANSDPKVFEEPRRFDPARTHRTLSFGQGIHFISGAHLARTARDCDQAGVRALSEHDARAGRRSRSSAECCAARASCGCRRLTVAQRGSWLDPRPALRLQRLDRAIEPASVSGYIRSPSSWRTMPIDAV
jgi:cytochrome P450